MYFVITNSDGYTRVTPVSKETLMKEITPDDDGNTDYGHIDNITFLDAIPEDTDTNYWGEGILIIKGEIVTPKPKEVVRSLEID